MKNSWFKKPAFQWVLKIALLGLAIFFIQKKLNQSLWDSLNALKLYQAALWIPLYGLLWILNFWLDAKLWQKAIQPLRLITLNAAFLNNLKFYAYSFISPANTGGLVARMSTFATREDKTMASLLSTELGLARYLSRFSIGLSTALWLVSLRFLPAAVALLIALLCFGSFLLLTKHWIRLTAWLPWKKWFGLIKLLGPDKTLPAKAEKHLLHLFGIACLRFLTYTSQFAVLLLVFGTPLKTDIFLAIPAFFLLSNLLPSFPAADFLIKGAIGLAVFQYFEEAPALLLASTTLLWASNWALPAVVGFFIPKNQSSTQLKT